MDGVRYEPHHYGNAGRREPLHRQRAIIRKICAMALASLFLEFSLGHQAAITEAGVVELQLLNDWIVQASNEI